MDGWHGWFSHQKYLNQYVIPIAVMDPWRQCFVVKDANPSYDYDSGWFFVHIFVNKYKRYLTTPTCWNTQHVFFFSGEVWWWSPCKILGPEPRSPWSIQIKIHLDLGHTGWGRWYIARWPSGGGGAWWWQGANWKEMNARKTWEAFVKSNSWKSRHKIIEHISLEETSFPLRC